MASKNRSTANHIVHDLLTNSQQYSFFQAVKLLNEFNHLISTKNGQQALKKTLIQFSVNPELVYNTSDIDSISIRETNEKLTALMSINFLGLYGAASPLPAFYSEAILQTKNGQDSARHFLDLFNHRMIILVYKCWEKYRFYQNYKAGSKDQFSNWMFALAGLYQPEQRNDPDVNWNRLLPFIGMLGMRCHSTSVLEAILKFYFKFEHFKTKTNIKRYVSISSDQQNRLGQQCATVNNDLVLGDRVEDRGGKFRILINKLPYEMFEKFLPDGEYSLPLKKIVNFILRDQLDYDIELQLLKYEVPKLLLSSNSYEKLGWTTWLGAQELQHKSIIIPGRT
ncbi:MAG: type VI secretion system baseplate subunit TssG [Gammaproteobacteria bacterium]|nr:type VI secretion system baseplate subunit TssG [Gammaproteobacteria bacterium]